MKKCICVLEDNVEILEVIGIVLEEENYEVHGFSTVSEFKSKFASLRPALCLLDVMLPDGSGLEVCEFIKSSELTKNIPVLMMTANSQIAKMRLTSAADDFIAKPFDINDLTERIYVLINTNRHSKIA